MGHHQQPPATTHRGTGEDNPARKELITHTISSITFGTGCLIDGRLKAPNGTWLNIRSAWFIHKEGAAGLYMWVSYDDEADMLYINFKKPSHATDSELTDEDVIIRYEGDEVVGLTVLHASKR